LVSLGYCLGYVFTSAYTMQQRRKFLLIAGSVCIVAFIILRYFNIYGDPHAWVSGKNFIYSVMAILRTTKYPVSLLYALMTLGPALLILGLIEPVRNKFTAFFVTIGSVPMFYYILHLPAFVILGFIAGSINMILEPCTFSMQELYWYCICCAGGIQNINSLTRSKNGCDICSNIYLYLLWPLRNLKVV